MRESVHDRRQRVLAAVQARGEVRVTELANELQVSTVTARRDVEELARSGRIRRAHGIALARRPAVPGRC